MIINNIELDAVWLNEHKNSKANLESKFTEDGSEWVFFKRTETPKDAMQFDVKFLEKQHLDTLKRMRDNAEIVVMTLTDARVFNVLIIGIDEKSIFEKTSYNPTDPYNLQLSIKEIKQWSQ